MFFAFVIGKEDRIGSILSGDVEVCRLAVMIALFVTLSLIMGAIVIWD